MNAFVTIAPINISGKRNVNSCSSSFTYTPPVTRHLRHQQVSVNNRTYNHVHHHFHSPISMLNSTMSKNSSSLKRLGVLASGSGRSVENLCEKIVQGSLTRCEIVVLVASKSTSGAINRVEPHGIASRVVRPIDYDKDVMVFSNAVSTVLDEFHVDFVIMAGWMHFYHIPQRYTGKVINIHPSLIPSFCGKGYYGTRVHQAVISFGAKISGCTVHLADNEYDHGPIMIQKAVHVLDTDTVDDLAARVFEEEKKSLPEAVQLLVDDRIHVENGIAQITAVTPAAHI